MVGRLLNSDFEANILILSVNPLEQGVKKRQGSAYNLDTDKPTSAVYSCKGCTTLVI